MIVVIAGSRHFTDMRLLEVALAGAAARGIVPSSILCGEAPGADTLGRRHGETHGIPVLPRPADWDNLEAPGAVIRRRQGTGSRASYYNARAGHDRNETMAQEADAGIVLWDGRSTGTKDMIDRLRRLGKPVHVHVPGVSDEPGLFDHLP